uniref:SWAP70 N-terminal EF-hand domain-containing protein n=1 Tax=Poecilia latipinna TaxID=48699 RepID=A0A3B3U444_9TELE
MDLKSELLKSIWYAFTSLDVERCGKVSKSQLKVLSHNLYTVLNIPHDPVALEEHFQDDDDGPPGPHGAGRGHVGVDVPGADEYGSAAEGDQRRGLQLGFARSLPGDVSQCPQEGGSS